jgi:hypothetical protein
MGSVGKKILLALPITITVSSGGKFVIVELCEANGGISVSKIYGPGSSVLLHRTFLKQKQLTIVKRK